MNSSSSYIATAMNSSSSYIATAMNSSSTSSPQMHFASSSLPPNLAADAAANIMSTMLYVHSHSFSSHHHNYYNVDPNSINLATNHHQFLVPALHYGFPETATEVYVPSLPPHLIHPYYYSAHQFLQPPPFFNFDGGVPQIPPPPPEDPELYVKIMKQIDYYFSTENLVKDVYLRKRMDKQGWVLIHVIAEFKRVKDLTHNIHLILDALATSSVVEVKGFRIRKRYHWKRWILPPDFELLTYNVREVAENTTDNVTVLAENLQNISLDNNTNNQQDHVQPS